MIPLILQQSLADTCREVFKDDLFRDTDNKLVPLNVYEQYLPRKKNNRNEEKFPYCIVKLQEGEHEEVFEPGLSQVLFIFGFFDEDDNFSGYKDVANSLNKLISNLERNPVINDQFQLKLPIRWALHEEDTYPYYFGAVETTWEIPNAIREDVEGLI